MIDSAGYSLPVILHAANGIKYMTRGHAGTDAGVFLADILLTYCPIYT